MNAIRGDDGRLFERLCLLRALYARRSRRDAQPVISVSDAVRYGEWLLSRPAVPAA